MSRHFCPYCGRDFTWEDEVRKIIFSHGGISFHQDCRREAIQAALRKCQEEMQESLKWRRI